MKPCSLWKHALLLLTAVALSTGCAGKVASTPAVQSVEQSETTEKWLQQGLDAARRGDSNRAEEYLAAALDAGASPDRALPALLRSCIAAGRYRTAAEHAEAYLHALDASRPEVELILATLYLSLDEPKLALRSLEHVVAARPNNATAHFLLAEMLREQLQEPERADRHFREYLRLEPRGRFSMEAREGLLTLVDPSLIQDDHAAAPLPNAAEERTVPEKIP